MLLQPEDSMTLLSSGSLLDFAEHYPLLLSSPSWTQIHIEANPLPSHAEDAEKGILQCPHCVRCWGGVRTLGMTAKCSPNRATAQLWRVL